MEEKENNKLFYVIKLIKKDGQRGYVIDSKEGIMICTDKVSMDITQFDDIKSARTFIKDKKLERNGTRAHIRTNEDLMKDELLHGVAPVKTDLYYFENEKKEKMFFDKKQEGYYFDKKDVGYCVWPNKGDAEKFHAAYKFPDTITIECHEYAGKN